ncbi:MAG: YhcH/YjgK/YiaL family protein [Bacteroidota bacterium]
MIINNISYKERYTNLHPQFTQAFDFINGFVPQKNIPGKIDIDGDTVFAIYSEPENANSNLSKLESHRKYIDIHFIISGSELFGWMPLLSCKSPIGDFNVEDDYILYDDKEFKKIQLTQSDFVIVYPEDTHAPGLETSDLKKLVIKIKL